MRVGFWLREQRLVIGLWWNKGSSLRLGNGREAGRGERRNASESSFKLYNQSDSGSILDGFLLLCSSRKLEKRSTVCWLGHHCGNAFRQFSWLCGILVCLAEKRRTITTTRKAYNFTNDSLRSWYHLFNLLFCASSPIRLAIFLV